MTIPEPITYFLKRAEGTVDLSLTNDRFVAKTQGTGLLDKPRVTDIALSDLKNFCLVKTMGIQNLVAPGSGGDFTFDSEFIFSFSHDGKPKNRRIFVNSRDPRFQALLERLTELCPGSSLLHLDPVEAQKQIGAVSSAKAVVVIIGILITVPILIGLIFFLSKILGR